jgi:hypothetical protein
MPKPFEAPHSVRHRPTFSDTLFLGFLALVLVAVAGVGRMAYVEGLKNEVSKKNALTWATWLEKAGTERFKDDFEFSGCAGGEAATGQTWADCLPELIGLAGPLADMHNPFTQQPLVFAAKCDPTNKSLAGALVIEKLVPTAPGSAVSFYPSPLADRDVIDQKMQLRVTACDQGAYPSQATEVAF